MNPRVVTISKSIPVCDNGLRVGFEGLDVDVCEGNFVNDDFEDFRFIHGSTDCWIIP